MKWRQLQNPEAIAAWKKGGRRIPFLEVTCSCGVVGVYRSKAFGRREPIVVRCSGCAALWPIVR